MMIPDRRHTLCGILASLGLHAMAALLLIGLPGQAMLPHDPAKLDLMWVTMSGNEVKDALPARKPGESIQEAPVVSAPQPAVQSSREEASSSVTLHAAEVKPVSIVSLPSGNSARVENAVRQDVSGVRTGQGAGETGTITRALPLYRENPPPGYPAIARQRGYEGMVLVEAEILPDGRVGEAEVRKTSGYAILDSAAVNAVKGWKFEPARKSGIPCRAKAELPIKFVLNDHRSSL